MTEWIAHHETHIGVVMLVGDRAYKLKKPVNLGFLDFSTRERRLAACRREVELNRRLAPDVYLGVADVSGPDGRLCDHLVVMKRMPADRRLSTLVRSGEPLDEVIRQLARLLAAFHATGGLADDLAIDGCRDAVQGRWQDSFAQVGAIARRIVGAEQIDEIEQLALEYLAGRKPLFDKRIRDGRIVDGHGDLLADDIFCLPGGPRVLDCLEFDDHLRRLDGLDDVAFLAMDLERLGAPVLAQRLLAGYQEFAGDRVPISLLSHYLAYRAFVRVKVACLRYEQGDLEAAEEARTYAEIAGRHLRVGRVRLTLVGGLPGSGKSTLSARLGGVLGAVVLSADRIRKETAGLSLLDDASAEYHAGIYTAEHTERTYTELLHRAETLLAQGESVVIDASWSNATHRVAARELAARTHSNLLELHCVVPAEVATQRIHTRRPNGSDANATIAARMAADADPWPEASTVDTMAAVSQTLVDALELVG